MIPKRNLQNLNVLIYWYYVQCSLHGALKMLMAIRVIGRSNEFLAFGIMAFLNEFLKYFGTSLDFEHNLEV